MSHSQPARTDSHHLPPSVGKVPAGPSRFVLLAKAKARNKAALKNVVARKDKARVKDNENPVEEDEKMGSSFLQYCAMCEKQIVVPNNSILYCSESCRRKDASAGSTATPYLSLYGSPFQSPTGEESDDPFGARIRPTISRANSSSRLLTARIPPLAHDGKSEPDPSEWKPNLHRAPASEAFQYLSQFHRSPVSLLPTRRPALQSRSTITTAAVTTPSLSHTPTTTTSPDESLAGTPYEFVTRPLLPRLDPKFSTSAGIKSVELVTPHIPSAFSEPTVISTGVNPCSQVKQDELEDSAALTSVSFEKKWELGAAGLAVGSLKKLLEVGNLSTAARTS